MFLNICAPLAFGKPLSEAQGNIRQEAEQQVHTHRGQAKGSFSCTLGTKPSWTNLPKTHSHPKRLHVGTDGGEATSQSSCSAQVPISQQPGELSLIEQTGKCPCTRIRQLKTGRGNMSVLFLQKAQALAAIDGRSPMWGTSIASVCLGDLLFCFAFYFW